ncbi:unnamed protein product [Rhizoctonia solani]|uniref:Uncharacterized protein n=1 Tax=Rhizoctonia solani TaxID=456999 RepID=A0A8H3HHK3_9AGAM|nr:unnamed protein product [Rhizoctonia solani]
MERRCEGLLVSPHLWPYIKIVTVSISRHRSHIVIPLFARLLGVLPNIHVLEVLPGGYTMTIQSLKKYFEGYSFPSIQKVVLPTFAHDILRYCPRVREVICNAGEGRQLVGALVHTGCSKLEILRGIPISSILRKRLSKANPPLKRIRINGRAIENLTESAISTFSAFSSLRVIEIEAGENDKLDEAVKFACNALRRCAEPKGAVKSWNLRESTKNIRLANTRSANVESRLVRILRYISMPTYPYGRTPENFVPVKVEEYPVEIE